MEDQLKEVLETVRFLKENAATKIDLVETEQRLQGEIRASEERIVLGVCEFMEKNVLPQLDSMSSNMGIMSKDIHLIKTALGRPILHS